MSKGERRVARVCEQCGVDFASPVSWPGRFCSKPCVYAWRRAQPRRITPLKYRRLGDDEPLPDGEPKRYRNSQGYIVLRWKIGRMNYVEVFEHRVLTGRRSAHVHHINGKKDDNAPSNLLPVSVLEHRAAHSKMDIPEAMALYAQGWSLPRLGARYGVDSSTVLRSLKRRGVVMRTFKEAWVIRKAS